VYTNTHTHTHTHMCIYTVYINSIYTQTNFYVRCDYSQLIEMTALYTIQSK